MRPISPSILLRKFAGKFLLFALPAGLALPASAAVFYSTTSLNQSAGNSWNSLSIWGANPDGSGADPTEIAGHDFIFQGSGNLRTPETTGTTTFAGNSLTIKSGSLLLKSKTTNIASFITEGGAMGNGGVPGASSAAGYNLFVNITDWSLSNSYTVNAGGTSAEPRNTRLAITTLTGSGSLNFGGTEFGTSYLSAVTSTGYTGNINLNLGMLNFDNDFVGGGSLNLATGSALTLDQNLTFTGLNIGGTSLGAGTYSFTDLNNAYDAFFTEGGSGSITVVPESSAAILGVAGLLLVRRRRDQSQRWN